MDSGAFSSTSPTAPIRRNVTSEDVGNAAAFLCSDLAAGVTGEIVYVDGGFSTVGMALGRTANNRRGSHERPRPLVICRYSKTFSLRTILALRSASAT